MRLKQINISLSPRFKHSLQVLTTTGVLFRKLQQKTPPKNLGLWLASEFQQLGPTYVKIGQFISSRQDIFSADFAQEFAMLQDRATPMTADELQSALLHIPDSYIVDAEPIASASIGQVHKAKVKGKPQQQLILKLRRPNIETQINSELNFLKGLMTIFSLPMLALPNIDHTMILLNEFQSFLSEETNLLKEARNLELFQETYKNAKHFNFVMPTLHEKNPNYLALEFVPNIGSITTYTGDRKQLAKDLMNFFVAQLIDYGVLHGDPHKGNVTVSSQGQIVLYDFGALLEFTKEERFLMKELVYMLIVGNKYAVCNILEKLGATVDDPEALEKYIDLYIQYVQTLNVAIFREESALNSSNTTLPIRLNGRIIRLLRVFGTLEGICKELDPEFNYFLLINNYITSLVSDEEFLRWKVVQDELRLRRTLRTSIFRFFS
jgi:predicted unusual protein kinase regulating ubiquinone biosynthesis (AarF/ABC1/UbiB family)